MTVFEWKFIQNTVNNKPNTNKQIELPYYKLAYTMFERGKLEVNGFCVNLPWYIFK